MNEMQQGANSASIPATTAAMTDPPKKNYYPSRSLTFIRNKEKRREISPGEHIATRQVTVSFHVPSLGLVAEA